MFRLALLIGGCFFAAILLRRLLPFGFTVRHTNLLDGLAVVGLLVFAIAVMDGVSALLADHPRRVLTYAAAVFGLNVGLQLLGTLAFLPRGLRTALTLGLTSGNGNLGLLLAALGDQASPEFQLFVAVAQFPIYLLPMVQRRLYRRLLPPGEPPA